MASITQVVAEVRGPSPAHRATAGGGEEQQVGRRARRRPGGHRPLHRGALPARGLTAETSRTLVATVRSSPLCLTSPGVIGDPGAQPRRVEILCGAGRQAGQVRVPQPSPRRPSMERSPRSPAAAAAQPATDLPRAGAQPRQPAGGGHGQPVSGRGGVRPTQLPIAAGGRRPRHRTPWREPVARPPLGSIRRRQPRPQPVRTARAAPPAAIAESKKGSDDPRLPGDDGRAQAAWTSTCCSLAVAMSSSMRSIAATSRARRSSAARYIWRSL